MKSVALTTEIFSDLIFAPKSAKGIPIANYQAEQYPATLYTVIERAD